jgi:hypothetical protein
MMLPHDRQGRIVLCYDASRLENDCAESRARCFAFMLQVALKDKSRDKGIVILFVINKLSFQRSRKDRSLPPLFKAYPIKIDSLHIIRQPARLGARSFDGEVVPALTWLFQPLKVPIHVHSVTAANLRERLTQGDFEMRYLPRSLGKFQMKAWTGQSELALSLYR